jgi:hypothetical protein
MKSINLTLIVLAMGLIAGAWLGYEFGTRKLHDTELALAKIRLSLDTENKQYQAALSDLKASATRVDEETKREHERIRLDYEGREKRLKASNDAADQRIGVLGAKLKLIQNERASLLQLPPTAAGGAKGSQRDREVMLATQEKAAENEMAGLRCLKTPVPSEQIQILQQRSTQ